MLVSRTIYLTCASKSLKFDDLYLFHWKKRYSSLNGISKPASRLKQFHFSANYESPDSCRVLCRAKLICFERDLKVINISLCEPGHRAYYHAASWLPVVVPRCLFWCVNSWNYKWCWLITRVSPVIYNGVVKIYTPPLYTLQRYW